MALFICDHPKVSVNRRVAGNSSVITPTTLNLVVDRIFVIALATFIEDSGSFINTSQLHSVEVHFVMATFRAWLFDCRVFAKFFLFFLLYDPRWFSWWGTPRCNLWNVDLIEMARKVAESASNSFVGSWRIHNGATLRAKRPCHWRFLKLAKPLLPNTRLVIRIAAFYPEGVKLWMIYETWLDEKMVAD